MCVLCVCAKLRIYEMSGRFRNWLGTSFEEDRPELSFAEYSCGQRERCPVSGRLHWQFLFCLVNAKTLSACKALLGATVHLEPCRDLPSAIKYCQKEESFVEGRFECGELPYSCRPRGWWQCLSDDELWELHPEWMLRNFNGVAAYRRSKRIRLEPRVKPMVELYIGVPGSGKSYKARQGDYYVKPHGDFWEGYVGQTRVVFDDFYGGERYADVLRWCSENPIYVPIKGSSIELKATEFIFTSNAHYSEWWDISKIKSLDAFKRRVTRVLIFKALNEFDVE